MIDANELATQEQMERVWGAKWVSAMPVLGAGDVETGCTGCGNFTDDKFDFCPHCGRAMTPEAMEIVRKRLEEMNDGEND
jgi:hypothetical protein